MSGAPPSGTCPSCGQHLDRSVRYCHHCGAWLPDGVGATALLPPPPASAGPVAPCPRCSYPSPLRSNFCANCGLRLNRAPLDAKEAKRRRQDAKQAGRPPDERDRSTIRFNLGLIVGGLLLLAGDAVYLVRYPGINSAYLGPIALLLLIRLPISFRNITRARDRLRSRPH